jgi:hypothetical protein
MNEINKNRWAKLAGINEDYKGNEEWEGSINGLGKDDNPEGFAEMVTSFYLSILTKVVVLIEWRFTTIIIM